MQRLARFLSLVTTNEGEAQGWKMRVEAIDRTILYDLNHILG